MPSPLAPLHPQPIHIPRPAAPVTRPLGRSLRRMDIASLASQRASDQLSFLQGYTVFRALHTITGTNALLEGPRNHGLIGPEEERAIQKMTLGYLEDMARGARYASSAIHAEQRRATEAGLGIVDFLASLTSGE